MLSLAQLFLILPLLLILHIIYQYFGRLRSLNAIPNAHPTAPFSSLWLLSIRYRQRESRTVWESHKRLGPVVRLAPDEVSVCTLQGLKTIYPNWEKTVWYDAFINYGARPLGSVLDSGPHAARKRLLSHVYSKSYIQNSSDVSTFNSLILTQKFLPKIATSASTGSSIDIIRLNMAFGTDAMSAYLFGSAHGTNLLNDNTACHGFLAAFAATKRGLFWGGRLPGLTQTLRHTGISFLQDVINGQAEMEDLCWKLCSRVETAMETNSLLPTSTAPIVYAQLSSALAKNMEKAPLSPTNNPDFLRKSVASEMLDHLVAGQDLIGTTLNYAMYELSRHPDFQTALRNELRSSTLPLTFPPSDSGSSAFSTSVPPSTIPRALDALPLLNAALYETLRLYPPISGGQPRVVPRGGAMLHGFMLPEGVMAQAAAYSVHRNEEVFSSAEDWIPERWLGERKKEVGEWFWAFGSGPRGCLGKNFAIQEMLVLLAAVYTNYSSHIVNVEGIEPVDDFIATPVAVEGKLVLRFEKVEH
ncbi:cytochrome P450 [Stipitochalara longipes BDJ]|nr:cytochrome P450 [Stipitochalara longipes BDJ]